MSALFNGSGFAGDGVSFVDGTGAPNHFSNGLPYEADSRLAMDTVSAISNHWQGLPFTANGRIAATDSATAASVQAGCIPIDAGGRYVVTVGTGISFAHGLGFTSGGAADGTNDVPVWPELPAPPAPAFPAVMDEALLWFDETGLVGNLTSWTNRGLAGPAGDAVVVLGTPTVVANAESGLDMYQGALSTNLRPAAVLPTIFRPFTTFVAFNLPSVVGSSNFWGEHPGSANSSGESSNNDNHRMRGSTSSNIGKVLGGDVNQVIGCRWDDATNTGRAFIDDDITVGQGGFPGDVDFLPYTIAATPNNSNPMLGQLGEWLIIPRALTGTEIEDVMNFLNAKWRP